MCISNEILHTLKIEKKSNKAYFTDEETKAQNKLT